MVLAWVCSQNIGQGYSHLKAWPELEIPDGRFIQIIHDYWREALTLLHGPLSWAVHNMASDSRENGQEVNHYLLLPNLGSDMPSFLLHSVGHTDQLWYSVGGTTQGCEYQEAVTWRFSWGLATTDLFLCGHVVSGWGKHFFFYTTLHKLCSGVLGIITPI